LIIFAELKLIRYVIAQFFPHTTPLAWEDKAANLAHLGQLIDGITAHTEVVVLPEMFSTGFSMRPESLAETMEGATVKWMREWAHKKRIILTGSVIIESGGRFYNRLLWVLPDQTIGYYDKRHRFAFAGEDEKYTSGSKRLIAQVKGIRLHWVAKSIQWCRSP